MNHELMDEQVRKHRRSLMAISAIVIAYQWEWIAPVADGTVSLLGYKLVKEHAGRALALVFVYFAWVYFQYWWASRREVLTNAARQWIYENKLRPLQKRFDDDEDFPPTAQVISKSHLPVWQSEWRYEFSFLYEGQRVGDHKDEVVPNPWFWYSIRACWHAVVVNPAGTDDFVPPVVAGGAVALTAWKWITGML